MIGASAPQVLVVQQAVIASMSAAAVLLYVHWAKLRPAQVLSPLALLAIAVVLFWPTLTGSSTSVHRWLNLFGFRLYVAPVVLPLLLLLWHQALSRRPPLPALAILCALLVGMALLVQPDAAQATALAIASIPILGFSSCNLPVRLFLMALLLLAALAAWQTPDLLHPVPYVEGVFHAAGSFSPWALPAAVVAALLPVGALTWLARRQASAGIFGVALYFATLYLLAPLQTTPVPLLGFGAGPILGYFVMVAHIARHNPNAV